MGKNWHCEVVGMFTKRLYFLLALLTTTVVILLFVFTVFSGSREDFVVIGLVSLCVLSPYLIYAFLNELRIKREATYTVQYEDAAIYMQYHWRMYISLLLSVMLCCIAFAGIIANGKQSNEYGEYGLLFDIAERMLPVGILLTIFIQVQMIKPVTNYFPPLRKIEHPEPLEYTTGLTYRDAEYWRFNHNRKKKKRKNDE
jgi:hypothetical protein